MKITPTLREANRLYKLGWAIHWLHPKSKRPIESGWTTGPRKSWEYLKQTYIDTLNIGVRLGTPSKLTKGYLAVVDVDVKSKLDHHRKEAVTHAMQLVEGIACPCVMSGRGNGSRHYYCVTANPFKTWNPATSNEEIKAHIPSRKPSKRELAELSTEEINAGIRFSPAWEISLYSDGRQVVLPPSIHPDTLEPYFWKRHITGIESLPLISFPIQSLEKSESGLSNPREEKEVDEKFNFIVSPVEMSWLPVSDKIKNAILHGAGVHDRSAYLLPAATALHSAGLNQNEILTVLTDRENYLGACAFDHGNTQDRARAAYWLYRYTVKRVVRERDGAGIFSKASESLVADKLSDEDLAAQTAEFELDRDWRDKLKRTGPKGNGPIAKSIENVMLVLHNAVGPNVTKRDLFSLKDVYGCITPWGGDVDKLVNDDDIPRIIYWLGKNFHFEPTKETIYSALTVIACENAFDPVLNSLEALPPWDRVKRLDTWLGKYFGATEHKENFDVSGRDEYLAQVFRKWMCGMVMRVFEPGSKFDWMPIFQGTQELGKSSFGKILVGDKYFTDWLPNLGDKDAALALQGVWAAEMGELSQFKKNELEIIKGYVTRTTDKFRPPHGRKTVESPRRCVFYGTTDKDKYLRDDAGNRRFKPVRVNQLVFDQLISDRDQLFAEAKWLYENFHETEWTMKLSGAAKEYEKLVHADKMVEDEAHVMREVIEDFFIKEMSKPEDERFNLNKFKIHNLFSGTGPIPKWRLDNRNQQFAAKALKWLGCEKWKSDGMIYWKLANRDRFGPAPIPHQKEGVFTYENS